MKNERGNVALVILLILAFNILIGGLATRYVLEFWVPKIVNHPVHVSMLVSCFLGFFVAEVTVPVAILTWFITLFL